MVPYQSTRLVMKIKSRQEKTTQEKSLLGLMLQHQGDSTGGCLWLTLLVDKVS
jgi:hypothetical protein